MLSSNQNQCILSDIFIYINKMKVVLESECSNYQQQKKSIYVADCPFICQ